MTVSEREASRGRHREMRYVQFRLVPHERPLNPLGTVLEEVPTADGRAILGLNLVADRTIAGLYELALDRSGSLDRLENALADDPNTVSYAVSRAGATGYAQVRTRTTETVWRLLEIPSRYGIVTETPIEFTVDGGLRVVAVSELSTFRDAVDDLPTCVGVTVEQTGPYVPESERVVAQLTERQRETVRVAIEVGYYEEPRRGTYDDIAAEMGITAETVGEHLRKAEATLVHETLGYHPSR